MIHNMTLMKRDENPNKEWWDEDFQEVKFWCSCGFKWVIGFREIYVYGYYTKLIEGHVRYTYDNYGILPRGWTSIDKPL